MIDSLRPAPVRVITKVCKTPAMSSEGAMNSRCALEEGGEFDMM
ncbi:MAG: hypothetical protein AAFN48_12680 [Pseudomonadota bacterium]